MKKLEHIVNAKAKKNSDEGIGWILNQGKKLDDEIIELFRTQFWESYKRGFLEGVIFERERIGRDLYTISMCCYDTQIDFTIEDSTGNKEAFTFDVGMDDCHRMAEIIGPCVYYKAKVKGDKE